VIILKPKPNGKKALVVYEGERKVKAMVKAFGNHMPEFVATISDDSYDAWESKPGAKAVLFSKKKEVPTILKALSTKYQGRMHFGIIDPSSIVLKARFLVSEYPQLLIVEDGRAVGKKDYIPIPYKGKSKFFSMDSFLLDFAGEKPSDDEPDSSNTTSESSKTQKAKSDSPTTSSPTSASTKDSEGKKKADKKKTTEKSKSKSKPAEKKSKKDEQDDASSETEEEKIVRKEKEKKIRKEKREKSKADAKKAAQKRKEKEAKKSKKKPKSGLRTLPQPANPIVLKGTDLKTLSVKELRGILARWDDPCNACTEKDQFLMKIADNRKEYGDMEAIAKMYAKKPSQRKRTAAHPDVGTGAKDSGGDGGNGEDDLLCGRMLKMETGPLLDQIQALTLENEELKQLLANAQEPLVHGEL